MTVPNAPMFVSAGLALCLSCFGQVGIVNTPAPRQQTPGLNSLSHIKLIEDFTGAHQATSTTGIKRPVRVYLMAKAPPAFADGDCAHVIVKLAPPEVDRRIVIGVPESSLGKIVIFKGLPQCLQDVR